MEQDMTRGNSSRQQSQTQDLQACRTFRKTFLMADIPADSAVPDPMINPVVMVTWSDK